MKGKLRKTLIGSSLLVGIAGTTLAIVLPLINKEVDSPGIQWDENQELFSGITGKDFLDKVKDDGKAEKDGLKDFDYTVGFFLYEKEQVGSLTLQEQWFNWEIFEKNNNIKDEQEKPDDTQSADDIKNWNKDIEKIEEKMKKLDEVKREVSNFDYDESNFSSNYPKVLKPLNILRENNRKKILDEKENFINKFATAQEGENEWPNRRSSLYGASATEEEAIDFLTNQDIQNDAYKQFEFFINDDYNYEQKWSKDKDGNLIFPFLQNAIEKTYSDDDSDFNPIDADISRKNEKVYFISSKSKIQDKMVINFNDSSSDSLINEILQTKLIEMSHALLPFAQDSNGSSLPWTGGSKVEEGFEKTFLKNMLTQFGKSSRTGLDILPLVLSNEDGGDTQSDLDKDTNTFINYFGSDKSGVDKGGSLGVRPTIGSSEAYVNTMGPGFSFASFPFLFNDTPSLENGDERLNDPADVTSGNKNFLIDLVEKIKEVANTMLDNNNGNPLFDSSGNLDSSYTNQKLSEGINGITDVARLKTLLGKAFQDTFDKDQDGAKLWYGAGKDAFIAPSSFGTHIIHLKEFKDSKEVRDSIEEDLTKVADEQNKSKSKSNWDGILNNHFKDYIRTDYIIRNYNNNDELKKYIETKNQDKEEEDKIDWDGITKLIVTLKNSAIIENMNSGLADKVKTFYIDNVDKELRENDPTLMWEDVYSSFVDYMVKD